MDDLGEQFNGLTGLDLLSAVVDRFSPSHVFALFSGGHDSLCATHLASQHPAFTAAVHVNTGIGIEQTRVFVRETCKTHGWDLLEYRADDLSRLNYRELVLKWGFPGPPGHMVMYNRLKERGIEALMREHKTCVRDRIVLVTGCRSQESTRRMGHVQIVQYEKCRLWVSIIHDWTKLDTSDYIAKEGLRRNEVVDLIHKSGECLCGAYAKKGEMAELELWFPDVAAEIHALEKEVRDAGFPWGWEERRPKWFDEQQKGQSFLFEMSELQPIMCQSCEKREEAAM